MTATRIFPTLMLVLLVACALPEQSKTNELVDPNRPIILLKHGSSPPNSVGGVEFRAQFKNTSGKSIKYVYFSVTARNRVGDLVIDQVRRRQEVTVEFTGPLDTGRTAGWPFPVRWSNVWYNSTIACASINKVRIVFFNDESVEFSGEKAASLISGSTCSEYN